MNRKLQKLEDRKAILRKNSEAMLAAAERESRDLRPDEKALFDANVKELDELGKQITEELMANSHAQPSMDGLDMNRAYGADSNAGFNFGIADDGRLIKALKREDRFCSANLEPFAVGQRLTDWMTGATSPKLEAVNYGGSQLDGGYLLNPELSQRVVDLARSASVCVKAGAVTIPMETNELALARIDGDPSAHWRPEGVAVPASKATFGRITLRSKTLACIVPITRELLEDAPNAPAVIEDCISKQLALRLDQACLAGIGAESEPLGVRNHADVNTIAGVGVPIDYTDPSEAIRDILTANYDGAVDDLRWVLHPRDAHSYDGLIAALSGQPMLKTPWIDKVAQLYTTSISITEGDGSDESYSVLGDFSQMAIGVRKQGVVFRRIPAGSVADADGNTYNAVSQLLEHLVAYVRVDVALLRPTWFSLLTGIETA